MSISNVSLTNTFDEWRVITNQLIGVTNDFLGDGLTTYRNITANVITANIVFAGANDLVLGTSSTERMRIDSSGNVGIGTASPLYKLHLESLTATTIGTFIVANASIVPLSSGGGSILRLVNANTSVDSVGGLGFGSYDTTSIVRHGAQIMFGKTSSWTGGGGVYPGYLSFWTRGFSPSDEIERMRIDANGKVGIGTTSPAAPLQVVGAARIGSGPSESTGACAIYNDGNDATIEAFAGNNVATKRNLLLQTYGGNVGIGTSSPVTPLHVVRPDTGTAALFSNASSAIRLLTYSGSLAIEGVDNTGFTSYQPLAIGGSYVQFTVSGLSKAIVDSSGNFGIGTDSPGAKLDVQGSNTFARVKSTSGDYALFDIDGPASKQGVLRFLANGVEQARILSATNDGPGILVFQRGTSSTESMRIDAGGNVNIGTASSTNFRTYIKLGSLAIPTNSRRNLLRLETETGNADSLEIFSLRSSSGGDWQTAAWRQQHLVDTTYKAYIQFNGHNNIDGLSFGTGSGSNPTDINERVRIDNFGNVGIGTTSPGSKLDVSSSGLNIVISRSTSNYAAFQRHAAAGFGAYDFYSINGVEAARITVDGSNIMAFATGPSATERMRIDNFGNVGIGTATTAATLDVVGSISDAKANSLNQTLTDASTITWDASLGRIATVTLSGNRVLANINNARIGTYILHVIQDGVGGRNLTFEQGYRFTANVSPPLTQTSNGRDVFTFVYDGSKMYGSFIPDIG